MPVFQPEHVVQPTEPDELVHYLSDSSYESLILGGGTFIHGLVSRGFLGQIDRLIDLSRMGWSTVEQNDPGWHLGATATFRDVLESPLTGTPGAGALRDSLEYPPPQITNLATWGGSLASASPLFDIPAALYALDAYLRVIGRDGERSMDLDDFFLGHFEHALESDEVITRVEIPPLPGSSASAFEKWDTNANDLAIVNVAARMTLEADGSTCRDARVVVAGGGVSRPRRVSEAESELVGNPLSGESVERTSTAVEESLDQEGDLRASAEYREYISGVLAKRVLRRIRDRLTGEDSRGNHR